LLEPKRPKARYISWSTPDRLINFSKTASCKSAALVLADVREPQALEEAAKQNGRAKDEVEIRLQDGFDHSYYFISTFTPEHVAFHAKYLKA
jgi:S-formylglutathione hydrolase FrmB